MFLKCQSSSSKVLCGGPVHSAPNLMKLMKLRLSHGFPDAPEKRQHQMETVDGDGRLPRDTRIVRTSCKVLPVSLASALPAYSRALQLPASPLRGTQPASAPCSQQRSHKTGRECGEPTEHTKRGHSTRSGELVVSGGLEPSTSRM